MMMQNAFTMCGGKFRSGTGMSESGLRTAVKESRRQLKTPLATEQRRFLLTYLFIGAS
jgi:hypothetical protein